MRKIFNINFMKYFKFFFILFICSFLTNNAYADCFGNVKFGDDLENVKKKEKMSAAMSGGKNKSKSTTTTCIV